MWPEAKSVFIFNALYMILNGEQNKLLFAESSESSNGSDDNVKLWNLKFCHTLESNASLTVGDTLSFVLFCVLMCFRRQGEGVRVFWDRLREPSFTSRWNPFATDLPFITFISHPVKSISGSFVTLCDVSQSSVWLCLKAQFTQITKTYSLTYL